MKHLFQLLFIFMLTLIFMGCSKNEETPFSNRETEKAQKEIKVYEKDNSAAQKSTVELALSALDQEIRELEIRVEKVEGEARVEAQQKLDGLRQRKEELRADFTEAKFKALLEDIKNTLR